MSSFASSTKLLLFTNWCACRREHPNIYEARNSLAPSYLAEQLYLCIEVLWHFYLDVPLSKLRILATVPLAQQDLWLGIQSHTVFGQVLYPPLMPLLALFLPYFVPISWTFVSIASHLIQVSNYGAPGDACCRTWTTKNVASEPENEPISLVRRTSSRLGEPNFLLLRSVAKPPGDQYFETWQVMKVIHK